ncbi:hypothetical protein KKG41_03170 [Patescibacteria group bacterium]|nr:hypothetical protein [Patescibacteria group bacterium]
MASGELSNLSWAELKKRFLVFDKHHLEFFNKPIWIPFPIEPVLSEATEKELQKIVTQDKAEDYQYYFENIFSPDKKNAINRENIDLLKIALKIKANQGLKKKLIKLHAKKYQWLPCYDINDDPWGSKEFTKMLDKILKQPLSSIKKELFEINKSYVRRCRAFEKILDTLPKTKRQKELFYMAHEMSFIKDERDDYRRLGSFNIQPLFKEIGRRVGLSIKEITQLTRSEMLELLDQQKINKQKCRQRLRGYVLLRKYNSEIKVFEGGQVGKLCHQELGSLAIKNVSGVKGTVGSVGKAKGPAQVIYTKHDLRKIKFGDIMIAVTTHPDFVPAMRRCKAVVTDEGGITCHASIVSRELKIPCIVGTQNATRIFKSGDTVEVDGFTGIVNRII